jgi:hypothetical protein
MTAASATARQRIIFAFISPQSLAGASAGSSLLCACSQYAEPTGHSQVSTLRLCAPGGFINQQQIGLHRLGVRSPPAHRDPDRP